jgi:hypothetical protein
MGGLSAMASADGHVVYTGTGGSWSDGGSPLETVTVNCGCYWLEGSPLNSYYDTSSFLQWNGDPVDLPLINENLQGWGRWFLKVGATFNRTGSALTILGETVDLIPTPPTWISGSTGVAIGSGMMGLRTTMQAAGVAFLYEAGDQYGATEGAIGVVLGAPQNPISAFAPIDPTDATAQWLTNNIFGQNGPQ